VLLNILVKSEHEGFLKDRKDEENFLSSDEHRPGKKCSGPDMAIAP
jgi:hypothetical protein